MTLNPILPVWLFGPILLVTLYICVSRVVSINRNNNDADRLTWIRRSIIGALLLVIALGPSISVDEDREAASNFDIIFAVDRSGSMSAVDGDSSGLTRLDLAKRDILSLAGNLPASRYGVVAFDSSSAIQMPLSLETGALKSWVNSLTPEVTEFSRGTSLNSAKPDIAAMAKEAHLLRPTNQILLFLLTDGESTDGTKVEDIDFSELNPLIYGGSVIGYGTADGAKMKATLPANISDDKDPAYADVVFEDDDRSKPFIKDPASNAPAISKRDDEVLPKIASTLGIKYVPRDDESSPGLAIADARVRNFHAEQVNRHAKTDILVVWPLALILGVCVLWELLTMMFLHFSSFVRKEERRD